MTQVAVIALLAWPLVSLASFAALGPWRGAIATYLGSYLLLSGQVGIPMAGMPDYTKFTAASLGALAGILIFDAGTLAAFRPRRYDAVALALCLTPAAAILANGLTAWQAISATSNAMLNWGLPYFVGRLYAGRPGADRDLALGLALAGALMAPLIAYEAIARRSLSGDLYGIPVENGYKYGMYRPIVMANNALELALWSSLAALSAFTLWCSRAVRTLGGRPFGWWAALAVGGLALCPETAALGLMGLGAFLVALTAGRRRFGALPEWAAAAAVVLVAPKLGGRITLTALSAVGLARHLRDRRPALLIYAAALAAPCYISLRATDAVSRQTLTVAAYSLLGADRGNSLEFRIATEELMVAHVLQRPLLGWGTFAEGRGWGAGVVIVDSLWIIQFAQFGLIGLAALYGTMSLPVVLTARRRPVETWADPRHGCAVALAACLIIYSLDSLLNAYIMLPVPMIAGLVMALPATRGARTTAFSEAAADRRLEQVGRLAALGRPAEAEAACRLLIASRSADPAGRGPLADAVDRLADLLEALGRPGEAERPRRRALGLRAALASAAPDDPAARAALASCAERLARNLAGRGRSAEAVPLRGLALEQRAALAARDPDDSGALLSYADGLNDLAWLLAVVADPAGGGGDPGRAVALAEQAVRVGPGRKAYWNTLAAAYRGAGRPGPAVAALRQSLRLGPDESGFDAALTALALADLGDSSGAREELDRVDARLGRLGPAAPAALLRLRDEAEAALRAPAPAGSP